MMQRMQGCGRGCSSRSDAGFTVVEVVIAVLVVAVLTTGAAKLLSSSGAAQTKAKVRHQETAIAEGVFEKVKADQSWAKSDACINTYQGVGRTCDISYIVNGGGPAPYQQPDPDIFHSELQGRFRVQVTAQGVDDRNDGLGPNDADSVLPDYFKVHISVALPDQSNNISTQPVEVSGTINPASRVETGTLVVQGCRSTPQVDERTAIAVCPRAAQPLAPPATFDVNRPSACASNDLDCNAFVCAHPSYRSRYCASKYMSVTTTPRADFVNLQYSPASGVFYEVAGADSNTRGLRRAGRLDNNGIAFLKGLRPGQYNVRFGTLSGFLPWSTHSVPAGGFAAVSPGTESRVVQLFQPSPARPFRVSIRTTDGSVPWDRKTYDYSFERTTCMALVPAPLGRAYMARPESAPFTTQIACAPPGSTYVEIRDAVPGLYQAAWLNSSNTRVYNLGNTPGFIWIPRTGDTVPTSTGPYADRALLTRSICKSDVRASLIAQYGDSHTVDGVEYKLSPCGGGSGTPSNLGGGGGGA